MARATASMVLPTPGGPRKQTLALAWTNSSAARSRTLRASRSGWKAKSKLSRLLWWGQARQLERVGEPPPLPDTELLLQHQVDELQIAHRLGLGPGDQRVEALAQVRQVKPL